MRNVQILDCTLRDGGYLLDKRFGDENIHGIVNGLLKTNIDIIEVGFLQNEGFGDGKVVFLNSAGAEKYIPKDKKDSIFTVFADYSRYDIHNLDPYTGKSFDAVRGCFFQREWRDAMEFCRRIKQKGYLLFVQPVDILGYSDRELLSLIEQVNQIEPYCFSIVDTFGSMYEDDLKRVFSMIHHNLNSKCRIGFHSHNNLQMSSALSQAFMKFASGKRKVVIDTTIAGMGRGAGNTPTELIIQYIMDKLEGSYEIDNLLDVIDHYMRNIRSQASWGYNTHFYLAGSYSAHVNNIAYLLKKNSIRSRDIRYILNRIDREARKGYDYERLENLYLDYMESDIDDSQDFSQLKKELSGKNILILAGGRSIREQREDILNYVKKNHTVVISINYLHDEIPADYIYISNTKRYQDFNNVGMNLPAIFTSNIKREKLGNEYIISFMRLIKCGWENMDNSTILLLRLLNEVDVSRIGIAGFDGYEIENNYAEQNHEYNMCIDDVMFINKELEEMLHDFMASKKREITVEMVTKSKFSIQAESEQLF